MRTAFALEEQTMRKNPQPTREKGYRLSRLPRAAPNCFFAVHSSRWGTKSPPSAILSTKNSPSGGRGRISQSRSRAQFD